MVICFFLMVILYTHYNEENKEDKLRISLDFRVMTIRDYNKYIEKNSILNTNPRDIFWNRQPKLMQIGGYYQITHKTESLETMMIWNNYKDMIMQHRNLLLGLNSGSNI